MSEMTVPPVASVASRTEQLELTAGTTRREQMSTLVPQADALMATAEQELEAASRDLTSAAANPELDIAPSQGRFTDAQAVRNRVAALQHRITTETQPVEVRYSFNSGVCGVYNPSTGRVQWETEAQGGIAGLYNPATRNVDWYRAQHEAIAAVRDPRSGRPEVRRNRNGGVAGVIDPTTNAPHFESALGAGVGMVVDAATRTVKSQAVGNNPVVGYINPDTGRFDFQSAKTDGMAIVYRDGDTYRSSCSYVPRMQLLPRDPFPRTPPVAATDEGSAPSAARAPRRRRPSPVRRTATRARRRRRAR